MSGELSGRRAVAVVVCTFLLLVQAVVWLFVFFALYLYAPRFKHVAQDSGLNLSQSQMLLIYSSDWFINYIYLGLPLLLAGLAVTTMAVFRLYGALARIEDDVK